MDEGITWVKWVAVVGVRVSRSDYTRSLCCTSPSSASSARLPETIRKPCTFCIAAGLTTPTFSEDGQMVTLNLSKASLSKIKVKRKLYNSLLKCL